jgi:UDP-N-acetylglucosamine--N-acetylmuramyl-(pentapeptide) pyrophosphoryl-undecaprenol N-acetylglucosamine transferase
LGARTVNQSIIAHLHTLSQSDIQVIWQTGKFYIDDARKAAEQFSLPNIIVTDFVSRMDYAYSIADLVISRAGASSISELCLLEKPTILVPSPNVAEDHQTQNALALVRKAASILIKDADAKAQLVPEALKLIHNNEKLNSLSQNISRLAQKDSANRIADEVMRLIN